MRKNNRGSSVILQWTHIPDLAEASLILRMVEDLHYRSYDTTVNSSHNGILCGRYSIIALWDDGSYVGYHRKEAESEELSAGEEMAYDTFKAMLEYKAGN